MKALIRSGNSNGIKSSEPLLCVARILLLGIVDVSVLVLKKHSCQKVADIDSTDIVYVRESPCHSYPSPDRHNSLRIVVLPQLNILYNDIDCHKSRLLPAKYILEYRIIAGF